MSLGSHGDDREIYRAQHLLSHGTKEQLTHLAPAPGAEKDTICLKLPDRGGNLRGGIALPHQGVAGNVPFAGPSAPWLQRLGGEVQCARGVVIRHPHSIDCHGCACREHMQKNEPRPRVTGLLEGEGH